MAKEKIAIIGYGLEGKSIENYFQGRYDIDIFKFPFDKPLDPQKYAMIFRSPSVPLHKLDVRIQAHLTSTTDYFFRHCPCPIIGVTGTKGKGTVCTMIAEILKDGDEVVHLVGNIGEPALDHLEKVQKGDVVVFELSSFQLWDLRLSPQIAVVLGVDEDHLDVHKDLDDYLDAKTNISRYQEPDEYTVYNKNYPASREIALESPGLALTYPFEFSPGIPSADMFTSLLDALPMVGEHNKENLQAAIVAVYLFYNYLSGQSVIEWQLEDFLSYNYLKLKRIIESLKPLPHHIELVREKNHVKYYDDSFCTAIPALKVALEAFEGQPLVLIAGGSSKKVDLAPAKDAIFNHKNLVKAVLIGETAEELAKGEDPEKYVLAGTDFEKAIKTAKDLAEAAAKEAGKDAVVLLSPCAASFDMFKSYKDRGDQFKNIVKKL